MEHRTYASVHVPHGAADSDFVVADWGDGTGEVEIEDITVEEYQHTAASSASLQRKPAAATERKPAKIPLPPGLRIVAGSDSRGKLWALKEDGGEKLRQLVQVVQGDDPAASFKLLLEAANRSAAGATKEELEVFVKGTSTFKRPPLANTHTHIRVPWSPSKLIFSVFS